MDHAPFSLQDSLIAYDEDRRAARVPNPRAKLGDAAINCILGIVDFSDDDSVHADHWEYHPEGDEILCVLEGRLLAAVDHDDATEEAVIEQEQAFIVPQASWHRLRVLEPGRLLFFTPTAGIELRPHASEEAGSEQDTPQVQRKPCSAHSAPRSADSTSKKPNRNEPLRKGRLS